ncbi:MAG: hypothetical protein HPY60_10950 [Candidatus Methanofastidiosum sp.]|nr:hypothetical protein [Methanofastidiosum sp.]
MSDLNENELIKFTLVAFKVSKMSLLEFSCEKSKQDYTQHQLMVLLCLKMRLKLDYHMFTTSIELMPELQGIIGLKSIPHYKT